MMAPLFGDFLAQAHGHVTAAVSVQEELPDEARSGVIRELDRLISILARYLGDMTLAGEFPQGPPGEDPAGGSRAVLDARIALRRSAQVLHHAASSMSEMDAGDLHQAAWHLARGASQLAAGRDLLHTHFSNDPSTGTRIRASTWAKVIHSAPVTDALLAEIGGLAAKLAPWMVRLSLESSPGTAMPAVAGLTFHDSGRWLWAAALRLETRSHQDPSAREGRRVLAAIPANLPPAHRPLTAQTTVPGLCEDVITTAARLQYGAAAFARAAHWSPQATSASWRHDALASAIIADSSDVIIRGLVQRAASLGLHPAIQGHLDNSARAVKLACTAWRAVTGEWDLLNTGTHKRAGPSPVAAEMDDLILGIGRLAYHNPGWTPACGDASLARTPADLARDAGGISTVLAAVHHAIDTLTHIAVTDHRCVRQAAADHRLYIPTRLLPEDCDIPYRYAPAPRSRVTDLLDGYRVAVKTCTAATTALDGLALAAGAPSCVLAAAHTAPAVTNRQVPAPGQVHTDRTWDLVSSGQLPATPVQPGRLEDVVRDLQLTEPALLIRAAAIDEATRDLLAEATAKAHHQSPGHEPASPIRARSSRHRR
jgi:hypothetical protein